MYLVGKMCDHTRERVRRLSAAASQSQQIADDDREKRNAAIVEADDEGADIRDIARTSGLSPAQVQRILGRATAERQHEAYHPEDDA